MRSIRRVFALLCALTILYFSAAVHPAAVSAVDEAEYAADGILAYKKSAAGAQSVQELIDGYLCENAGMLSEWYILGLSQSKNARFDNYEKALLYYLDSHNVISATSRQKYALILISVGSTSDYIKETVNNSIGELGVMSYIFGLHLLNNGCQSNRYTAEDVIGILLDLRTSDGGWAVMGSHMDTDVTAMALSALAPYYHRYSDVDSAVDTALSLLSEKQNSDGGYSGFGGENCESTVQVLCALSCLGIDQNTDSRFIKNGNTILNAVMSYRLLDGSFSHVRGGASDESAAIQTYYSMVAYIRMKQNRGSLYLCDRRSPLPSNVTDDPHQGGGSPSTDTDHQNIDQGGQNTSSQNGSQNTVSQNSNQNNTKNNTTAPTSAAATGSTQLPTDIEKDSASTTDESTPSQLSTASSATKDESIGKKAGYKLWAVLIIIAAGLIICWALLFLKKRNKKNFLFIGGIMLVLILFVLLTDFSTKDGYYQTEQEENAAGAVTLSIRCDTVKDENNPYIPFDGVILGETEFSFSEGETVYDILIDASKEYHIPLDENGSYVRGINHIYEFDYGELSGWMYKVNGITPSVGCRQYTLSQGDTIEWLYTTNMGEDLTQNFD